MFGLDNKSGINVMPPMAPADSQTPLWFTEGGAGQPATYPGQDWFNQMQAELLNVLKAAGVAPKKGDLTQLATAIKKIVTANMPEVPKVNDASTTQKGIVQLDDAISDSKTKVPVSAAVKTALEDCQPKGNYADKSEIQAQAFAGGIASKGDILAGGVLAVSSGNDQLSFVLNVGTHQYALSQKINGVWIDKLLLPQSGGKLVTAGALFGAGQAWRDETKNRSLSTSFTNTSNKPIMISVSVEQPSGDNAAALTLKVNDVVVGDAVSRYGGSRKSVCLSAVVPPGSSYSAQNSGAIWGYLYTWAEMK